MALKLLGSLESSGGNVGIGTATPSAKLEVVGSGGTVLDIQGSVGQLFSVTDSLTGDLFAVSDISGIPILNVNSSGAVDIDGTLNLGDSNKIQLGASQDLQIYHDGTHNYIDGITNDLYIRTISPGDDVVVQAYDDLFLYTNNGADAIIARGGAAVEVYHNNVKKLETTSTGVTVTGDVGMATGHSSGKFAVMSTSVHASYDFYNNGTSYLNGAVTVDAAFTQTGSAASTFSGTIAASNLSGTNTGDQDLSSYLTAETFSSSDVVMSLSGTDVIAGESITLAGGLSYSGTTLTSANDNTTYTAGTGLTLTGTSFSVTANTYAPLASPALTGTPTAPTAAAATNTTQLATTAFVSTAIANLSDSAPATLDTLNELAAALGDDANFSTTVTNSIATKLPLAGGTMTGDLIIGTAASAGLTQAFGNFDQLKFDNSHSDSARGPNKIVMHDNGSSWRGGFGIHSGTVAYYSGDKHIWYKTGSSDSYTERMTLDGSGNLSIDGTLSASGYNKSNWDTAYNWGNHASGGYLTSETFGSSDVVFSLSGDDVTAGESITLAGGLSYSGTTLTSANDNTTYTAGTGLTLTGTSFSVTANTYATAAQGTTADAALPKAGGTMTGALTINQNGSALNLRSTTNSQPSRITFSSDVPADQIGYIEYSHVNTASYGSGESFVIGGNQGNITILADGKLMYAEGIYSKPSSGTGAGTRKDANWDTAYSWGDHASASYLTAETFSSSDVVLSLSGTDVTAGESITLAGGLSYSGTTLTSANDNTTYTAGTGLTLTGTSFSVTSNTYATAAQGTTADAALPKAGGTMTGILSHNNRAATNVAHWSASGNSTGAIKITIPGSHSSNWSMLVLRITAYEYNSSNHTVYYVSGHDWTSGWYNNGVTKLGDSSKDISLAYDGDKDYVILGLTTASWTYGHVTVDVVSHPSFYSGTMNISSGWAISQVTSLEGITVQSVTNRKVLTNADEGSGNGIDADTVDGLQAASFLRSDANDTASGTLTLSGSDWYLLGLGARGASAGAYGIGNRNDNNYRQLTFHVPNQAAYSSTGTIPSFGWYSNGAVQLMKLESGSGDLTVTGTVSASNLSGTNTGDQVLPTLSSLGALSASGTAFSLSGNDVTVGESITLAGGLSYSGTTLTSADTTYTVGDGGLTQKNFTTTLQTKLDGIEASADVTDTANVVAALTAGTNVQIAANGTISATDTNTTYSTADFDAAGSADAVQSNLDSVAANVAGISNQSNTDVDTGTETIAQVAKGTYTAAFFDFVIKNGTNVRAGTVYSCHDGTNVEFTETSTVDLGDTSDVTLAVDISGTNMRLRATTTSNDWSVKSLVRAI